jgi:hypothetical protein
MKPNVFIGSSTQGLPIAELVQKELGPVDIKGTPLELRM